jgi:hypothetical protein
MNPNWRRYSIAAAMLIAMAIVLALWAVIRRVIRGW